MVDHAGTDGLTYDIPKRVGRLETSVEGLHKDSVKTQAALAGLQKSQDAINHSLNDIAGKLDYHRTKRPDMGAMAAVAGVIIMLGASVLWPTNSRLQALEEYRIESIQRQIDNATRIGALQADREYMRSELDEHDKLLGSMQRDRFTKDDGQRLEDKVDRIHDR